MSPSRRWYAEHAQRVWPDARRRPRTGMTAGFGVAAGRVGVGLGVTGAFVGLGVTGAFVGVGFGVTGAFVGLGVTGAFVGVAAGLGVVGTGPACMDTQKRRANRV